MKYEEAVKRVRTEKPKENMMLIRIDYETQILLPYSAGVSFISAMSNAQMLKESYGKPARITDFTRDSLTTATMSISEYERIRIATLLGVTPAEVLEAEIGTNTS